MVLNKLIAFYYYRRATSLRTQGSYTKLTLRFYFKAQHKSQSIHYLVAYIRYRRDLGFTLSRGLGKKLLAIWGSLPQRYQDLILAYLLEFADKGSLGTVLPKSSLNPNDYAIPASLSFLSSDISPEQQNLLRVYTEQSNWRAALQKYLRVAAQGAGICIVGNAGILNAAKLGAQIDAHAVVVRFNAFTQEPNQLVDVGQHTQVWCLTPSFKVANVKDIPWIILAGPEVQYSLRDWSQFYPFCEQGIPIVTIPLAVWRALVAQLEAPPSAGICLLAFFYSLLGSWQGIAVAGFGALSQKDAAYHYMASTNKAGQRHNWSGEARLLQCWLGQGLSSLH